MEETSFLLRILNEGCPGILKEEEELEAVHPRTKV